LRYFHDEGWPIDWIDTVKEITHAVYDEDYSSCTTVNLPVTPRKPRALSSDRHSLMRKKGVKAISPARDELADFWGSPRLSHDADPLLYWQGIMMSDPDNRLAYMAIDYLSAPAASADVERAFSRGALTVTHRRHSLSDSSTRNSVVLGSWLRDTNLVPRTEIIEFFCNKSVRFPSISTSTTRDSVDADSNPDSAIDNSSTATS